MYFTGRNFTMPFLKNSRVLLVAVRQMVSKCQNILCVADAVCFDVDSTVIKEEAIDELAVYLGKGAEISELTKQAMSGKMEFQAALTMRLNIMKPSLTQICNFIRDKPCLLTPGVKQLIEILQKRGVAVYLISGGFRCIIIPVASTLGIPPENVFANRFTFYYTGEYAGFDETQPTSKSGGKGAVIKMLKDRYGYKKVVVIGDGMTDLEASPPADAFIGYGGNVIRQAVKVKAEWFVTDFAELITVLQK